MVRGTIQTGSPSRRSTRRRARESTPEEEAPRTPLPPHLQVETPLRREPDSELEDDYDERAPNLVNIVKFPIRTKKNYEVACRIGFSKFHNTKSLLNIAELASLGVDEPILYILDRAGIHRKFWEISTPACRPWTIEFLATMRIITHNNERTLKFRIGGKAERVSFSQLRRFFGFSQNPQMVPDFFSGIHDKNSFWHRITGVPVPVANKNWRSNLIPHPVLRILHRILCCTIFARGESTSRANREELYLMDALLQPEASFRKPDILEVMLQHWITIRESKRDRGMITLGSYIAHIVRKLHLSRFPREEMHEEDQTIGIDLFAKAQFIKVIPTQPGQPRRYIWLQNGQEAFDLPANIPFTPWDPATYLPQPILAQPQPGEAQPEAEHGEPPYRRSASPPHSPPVQPTYEQPPPVHPQQYHDEYQWATPPQQWYQTIDTRMASLADQMSTMMTLQTDQHQLTLDRMTGLSDQIGNLDRRVQNVEYHLYEDRFYWEYGYYPGGQGDPNVGQSSQQGTEAQPDQQVPGPVNMEVDEGDDEEEEEEEEEESEEEEDDSGESSE